MLPDLTPAAWSARGAVLEVAARPGAGATSVLLSFLAPLGKEGPVAYLDARGEVNPEAAAEAGCPLERLALVRASRPDDWARAMGYLLDGVRAIAAEVPGGVPASALRALTARARARNRLLVLAPLKGRLPAGLCSGSLLLSAPHWTGAAHGRGTLQARTLEVRVEGKVAHGSVVHGLLRPPSLALEPLSPAEGARRLAAVR